MLPLVLLPTLQTPDLLALNLARLLDLLRHVAVAADALDLRHVAVARPQRGVVFEFLALAGGLDPRARRGVRAPQSDVAVVGSGQDVGVVRREAGREDALHAFGVVDVAAVAFV